MKMQKIMVLVMVIMLATVSLTLVSTADTEENEPYQTGIYDWEDLYNVRNDLEGAYILMNNLGADTHDYGDYNTGDGWDPIGDDTNGFDGTFDGNGYTISDLYINRPTEAFVGLFGYTETSSEILDVKLIDVDVSGEQRAGGLVGYNNGLVTDSSVHGIISGETWYNGGLVGYNFDTGEVTRSYSTGTVEGASGIGGFIGLNRGTISESYSMSDVTATGNFIGGLVGEQRGNVINSYSTGEVNGSNWVGGLIGDNYGTVENSFWDVDTSNQGTSDGGTGKTTAEMKNVATFTDLSTVGLDEPWDFIGNPYDDIGDEDIWHIDGRIKDGYPLLSREPSLIYDWYDLNAVRNDMGGSYLLMNDLDENSAGYDDIVNTAEGFAPIGTGTSVNAFTGDLYGDGYEIRDLYINRPDEIYVGLFGSVGGSIIQGLRVSGSVTGNGWVGGVVGYSSTGTTTIERTVANVDVTNINTSAYERVGGLIGIMHNGNRMSDCAAHGSVDGPDGAILGGLVGSIYHADVIIETSYATGLVNGGDSGVDVGGLIGYKHVDAQVIDSYWDVETSGQDTSAAGTPLSTDEMTGGRATATGNMEGFGFYGIWVITEMYPELAVHYDINDHLGGQGTEAEPYLIETLVGLQTMNQALDANFSLEADIDASETQIWYGGSGFNPIGHGVSGFAGSFNGNGYTISDLYINRPTETFVGLFGYTETSSEILNVELMDADVSGEQRAGGLVGYNNGLVTDSSVHGIISGETWYNGGLVGYNFDTGEVTRSYSTGTVEGASGIGGFIGLNRGTISESYSMSDVTATGNFIGGLVGEQRGNVINSYSTGEVNGSNWVGGLIGDNYGTVENSFWDVDTSNQGTSDGGTGKTTAEMKNSETFTNTDTEGLDSPWDIEVIAAPDIEDDYPYLNWENGSPVWYIEQTAYAETFEISVNDITAGEQPLIDIFNAVDQFGDPLEGNYVVTIEIDLEEDDVPLSFINGEADHSWTQMTEVGVYTANVTIDEVTESDSFNVNPEEVVTVTISPVDNQTTVIAGEDLSFTAEARDDYGNLITDDVTEFDWDNSTIGVFNQEIAGEYDVTATYGDVTSEPVTITVEPGDPDHIEISPQESTIEEGQSETYTAIAYDEFDNDIGEVTADTDWSIEGGAGGSWVDNVYTSENLGTWTVTGTYQGLTDTATLTVVGEGVIEEFSLTIESTSGGSVTSPGEDTFDYSEGTVVDLVAQADQDWEFVEWTGDIGSIADPASAVTTITMDGDYSITAEFETDLDTYQLTIEVDGEGITSPLPGTHSYIAGTSVTLTAIPDDGCRFTGWTGDATGSASEITVNMDEDKTITANFEEEDVIDDEPTDFLSDYWWILLLLLIIIVIVVIVLVMKRSKKEPPIQQPPEEPVGQQPPEGQYQGEHAPPEQPPTESVEEVESPPPIDESAETSPPPPPPEG